MLHWTGSRVLTCCTIWNLLFSGQLHGHGHSTRLECGAGTKRGVLSQGCLRNPHCASRDDKSGGHACWSASQRDCQPQDLVCVKEWTRDSLLQHWEGYLRPNAGLSLSLLYISTLFFFFFSSFSLSYCNFFFLPRHRKVFPRSESVVKSYRFPLRYLVQPACACFSFFPCDFNG
ncbi:hypothetical protein LY76DRAFT_190993 [Colletotrichum caudatum]|nr:hypothetical protein LY76DRAFT_190993 [Colletotrichum caudatum]